MGGMFLKVIVQEKPDGQSCSEAHSWSARFKHFTKPPRPPCNPVCKHRHRFSSLCCDDIHGWPQCNLHGSDSSRRLQKTGLTGKCHQTTQKLAFSYLWPRTQRPWLSERHTIRFPKEASSPNQSCCLVFASKKGDKGMLFLSEFCVFSSFSRPSIFRSEGMPSGWVQREKNPEFQVGIGPSLDLTHSTDW